MGDGVDQRTTIGSEGKVEAIVPAPKAPWYHTVQQRHYTKAYPKTQEFQELFGDLREARAHGWRLTALVQQHDSLTTTFTRYPSSTEADQRLSEQTW